MTRPPFFVRREHARSQKNGAGASHVTLRHFIRSYIVERPILAESGMIVLGVFVRQGFYDAILS
jgi:hypothetical protein